MSILGKLVGLIPGGQAVAAADFFAEHWKTIVAVVATVLVLGVTYWAGGRAPRAELAARIAEDKAAEAMQKAEDEVKIAESAEFVSNLNRKHDEDLKSTAALWAAELARVQHDAGSRPAAKPIQPAPKVCTDQAGNDRLSRALQSYMGEVRRVVGDIEAAARDSRAADGRQLAVCEPYAKALAEVVQWSEHEHALWDEGSKGPLKLR